MEKFKAVEKEMKTKAYSKEGLLSGGKLDPKEKEKVEICDFLSKMVDELERQIEQVEAETDKLAATAKKSKKGNNNAERLADLEHRRDRHKWHQSKLEMLQRKVENDGIEPDVVKAKEEEIKYYVESNEEPDFMEDEEIYDDLDLEEDEEGFGNDGLDKVSSQDAASVAEDVEADRSTPAPARAKAPTTESTTATATTATARRPSLHSKSPLPALTTLQPPLPTPPVGVTTTAMKPAPPPVRTPGEPLKYASAAAAAAASDKSGIGISPLPAPSGASAPPLVSALPATAAPLAKSIATASPSSVNAQPIAIQPQRQGSLSSKSSVSVAAVTNDVPSLSSTPAPQEKPAAPISKAIERPVAESSTSKQSQHTASSSDDAIATSSTPALTNGDTHSEPEEGEEESIYHLPSSLADLLDSFNATRSAALATSTPDTLAQTSRLLNASLATAPDNTDAERPNHYRPVNPIAFSPAYYPQEPLSIFNDPELYKRMDTDTLFYTFYYAQNTYQQFLAAKALKQQSWRFHKQYSTWFQRHEEPKKITDEFEQGTYRFFDYESTW